MTSIQNNLDLLNLNGLGQGGGTPPPTQADQLLNLKLLEALCAIMGQFADLQTKAAQSASKQDAKADAAGQATAQVVAGNKSSAGSSNSPNTGAPAASGGAVTGGVGAVGA